MHAKQRRNNMNGGRHHNNRPRRFTNNGGRQDDSANVARTRRHATQQREKYQNMARDAMSMGDRVLAENHLQHADHYHRVILSLPPEEQPRQHFQQRHAAGDEAGAIEGDAMHEPEGGVIDAEPQPIASSALPAFITQQTVSEHPPQSYEE